MRRALKRLSPASLLLALMLFSALPRTLFHHCAEGAVAGAHGDARTSVVHADTHCPICEAPAPICDAVAPCPLNMGMVLLGTCTDVIPASPARAEAATPRLRGPPQLA